ncbi:MAG: hypothetical protein R3A44_42410 [Caldilineaceae bacterium]
MERASNEQTAGILRALNSRDIGQHVTIVGWLLIIGHVVFLLVGAFVFFVLNGVGVLSGDPQATAILSMVGTAVGSLLALLSLPGIIAGVGVLKRQEWARYLALVVAILGLVNFPLGTIVGLYTIWVLLQESALTYFARGDGV